MKALLLAISLTVGSNDLIGRPNDIFPVNVQTKDPYMEAYDQALKSNTALIVWNGVKAHRKFEDCVTVEANLPEFRPGLVISVPKDGSLLYLDTVSVNAPLSTINRLIHPQRERQVMVPQERPPFYELLTSKVGGVEDEAKAAGPWPKGLPFLDELVHYTPTKLTQSIATRNGAPAIDLVPRSTLLPKWQVPGGLEAAHGWRSDLYKLVPYRYKWKGMIPVKNQFNNFQNELGVKQEYPDGTLFMDVLSNAKTGKVFEHRVREKHNGDWHSYVVFRDREQRPAGYNGLQGKQCISCHQEAGTGGYGTGLVPGGDTVISDHLLEP